jgi:hypothetical protein
LRCGRLAKARIDSETRGCAPLLSLARKQKAAR